MIEKKTRDARKLSIRNSDATLRHASTSELEEEKKEGRRNRKRDANLALRSVFKAGGLHPRFSRLAVHLSIFTPWLRSLSLTSISAIGNAPNFHSSIVARTRPHIRTPRNVCVPNMRTKEETRYSRTFFHGDYP